MVKNHKHIYIVIAIITMMIMPSFLAEKSQNNNQQINASIDPKYQTVEISDSLKQQLESLKNNEPFETKEPIVTKSLEISQVSTSKKQTKKEIEKEIIVYITRTGSKYHRGSCSYLRQSKIKINKNNAIKQGYTPCSRCKP